MSVEYTADGAGFTFEDATGLVTAEGDVSKPDGPYPAMVFVTVYRDGGSLLAPDARALGEVLIRLADHADRLDNEHVARSHPERVETETE